MIKNQVKSVREPAYVSLPRAALFDNNQAFVLPDHCVIAILCLSCKYTGHCNDVILSAMASQITSLAICLFCILAFLFRLCMHDEEGPARRSDEAPIICHTDGLKYRSAKFRLQTLQKHTADRKVHGTNMGPIWTDRSQVGPMLAQWTLLSGTVVI